MARYCLFRLPLPRAAAASRKEKEQKQCIDRVTFKPIVKEFKKSISRVLQAIYILARSLEQQPYTCCFFVSHVTQHISA